MLGPFPRIGLKDARDERARLRALLADGLDPLAQRRIAAEEERTKLGAAMAMHRVSKPAVAP